MLQQCMLEEELETDLDKIITVQSVLYSHTNYVDDYLVYKSIAIMATPAITLQDGIYSSSRTNLSSPIVGPQRNLRSLSSMLQRIST